MSVTKQYSPLEEDDRRERDFPVENNEPGEIGYNTGDDEIEVEKGEGEKIVYGSSFSPKDGDLGDESEDRGDLPSALKEFGHEYNPTLSSGPADTFEDGDELKQGIHIVKAEDAGMAYGPDRYTEEEEDTDGDTK
jgi:hypothetical protein